ncbi:MAG: hypothetical protein HOV81_09380 [Kofleriaceae bacterium]|nr:hypothetical protein [Kofleriaceae bacterium]
MKNALLPLLAVAAIGCPKSGDKPKPVAEPARRDALPKVDDPTLPPAAALPAMPAGLPDVPANPRVTPDAVAFGEVLFRDPQLSHDRSRSCATCHDPAHGFSGDVATAADGKPNFRRSPALVNLAWVKDLGWDGRYASISDLLPPHIKGQLGEAIEPLANRLAENPLYHAHVARIGGTPRDAITQALEAYVLTRYDGDAPWDSLERTALSRPGTTPSDPIVAGYQLFMGKAQCGVCHPPPLYTDGGYHRVAGNPLSDPGRGKIDPALAGAFRTPTLRGAARRPAFFHTGSAKSLDDVVLHYQQEAAVVNPDPAVIDPLVSKIRISAGEAKDLVAFLRALSAQ